jgi:hypothetical protein
VKLPKFKKWDFYHIEFWDHARGDHEVKIHVRGWFFSETDRAIRLTSWALDEEHGEERELDQNLELMSILKVCITKARKING